MSELQPIPGGESGVLLDDLKTLIDQARQQVAVAVNVGLTHLYWQVGQRIRKDLLLEEDRAAYGKKILATLSQELTQRYGKGFTESALNRMVKFAEVFPDSQIVATLSHQLSWYPCRAGRPESGDGGTGGEDSGELRGVGGMTPMPAIKATVVNLGSDPSPKGAGSDPKFTVHTSDSVSQSPGCHTGLDPVSMQHNSYAFCSYLRKKYKDGFKSKGYSLFSCKKQASRARGRLTLKLGEGVRV